MKQKSVDVDVPGWLFHGDISRKETRSDGKEGKLIRKKEKKKKENVYKDSLACG